ncbi:MAG TPA: hypothetical protein VF509_09665 [Sphingobium sp.]
MNKLKVCLLASASVTTAIVSSPILAQSTAQNVSVPRLAGQASDSQASVAARKRLESVNKVGISINAVSNDTLH